MPHSIRTCRCRSRDSSKRETKSVLIFLRGLCRPNACSVPQPYLATCWDDGSSVKRYRPWYTWINRILEDYRNQNPLIEEFETLRKAVFSFCMTAMGRLLPVRNLNLVNFQRPLCIYNTELLLRLSI